MSNSLINTVCVQQIIKKWLAFEGAHGCKNGGFQNIN